MPSSEITGVAALAMAYARASYELIKSDSQALAAYEKLVGALGRCGRVNVELAVEPDGRLAIAWPTMTVRIPPEAVAELYERAGQTKAIEDALKGGS